MTLRKFRIVGLIFGGIILGLTISALGFGLWAVATLSFPAAIASCASLTSAAVTIIVAQSFYERHKWIYALDRCDRQDVGEMSKEFRDIE